MKGVGKSLNMDYGKSLNMEKVLLYKEPYYEKSFIMKGS